MVKISNIFDFRNITTIFLAVFLLESFSSGYTYNKKIFNSIRIAHNMQGEEIGSLLLDDFLLKAKNAKYNYVLAQFNMNRGKPMPATINDKKVVFKKSFIKVGQYNLRMIPLVCTGSAHDAQGEGQWCFAKYGLPEIPTPWNPNIKLNLVWGRTDGSSDETSWGTTAFTADPNGVDKTFIEYLTMIKQAHEEAHVSYPVEYIHIGHDEMTFYDVCLIGGAPSFNVNGISKITSLNGNRNWYIAEDPSPNGNTYNGTPRVRTFVQSDRDFIDSCIAQGNDISTAFAKIIVTEIYRRLEQVQSVFGSKTKILIHGDMFDPSLNGGARFVTYKSVPSFNENKITNWSNTIQLCPVIATLPGLTNDQKLKFQKNVIIIPWNYDVTVSNQMALMNGKLSYTSWNYDVDKTFKYFKDNNLKFIYGDELIEGNNSITIGRSNQMHNWCINALNYQSSCMGYAAFSWSDWPAKSFNTIDSLYKLNSNRIPEK